MSKVRVGTSGWSYDSWRGAFYPEGLPHRRELEYASRKLDSIEVNGSFYSLLKPETYESWYGQTPRGFRLAVKGSRFITHNKKLRDPEVPLANFLASGVLCLADKLGPIVWQLPEQLGFDEKRFDAFLELLPHDTREAAKLASRHDERLEGRSFTKVEARHRLRHALEVRTEGLLTPELAGLARRHGVALVVSDAADWPLTEELTAGFVYVRLHGSKKTYASRYPDGELDRWAKKIAAWNEGAEPSTPQHITDREPPRRKTRDVYVYFDNDQNAHAPEDALRLRERLDL